MKTETQTIYVAFDGKKFTDYSACLDYEETQEEKQLLNLGFKDITEELVCFGTLESLGNHGDERVFLCNVKEQDNFRKFSNLLSKTGWGFHDPLDAVERMEIELKPFDNKGVIYTFDGEITEIKSLELFRRNFNDLRYKLKDVEEM